MKTKPSAEGRQIYWLTVFILAVILMAASGSEAAMADDPVCDLSQAQDSALQRQLEELLEQEQLSSVAKRGELALTLLVLSDPEHPRLAQVNGNRMMYAASLPKIVILLGAAVAIDEGRLSLDDELAQDLNLMVRKSCNPCANRMIERVGKQQLVEIVQSPRFRFYEAGQGGLWLGKPYGPNLAWQREPLRELSHAATTFQTARFYCGLERGTLVSPEQNQLMLSAMSKPGINHKFVKGLAPYKDIEIFRKSGTWTTWHADSALVRSDGASYVIVGLAHSPFGGYWLEQLAGPLHELAVAPPGRQ
jgi:beta-lactamase class A